VSQTKFGYLGFLCGCAWQRPARYVRYKQLQKNFMLNAVKQLCRGNNSIAVMKR